MATAVDSQSGTQERRRRPKGLTSNCIVLGLIGIANLVLGIGALADWSVLAGIFQPWAWVTILLGAASVFLASQCWLMREWARQGAIGVMGLDIAAAVVVYLAHSGVVSIDWSSAAVFVLIRVAIIRGLLDYDLQTAFAAAEKERTEQSLADPFADPEPDRGRFLTVGVAVALAAVLVAAAVVALDPGESQSGASSDSSSEPEVLPDRASDGEFTVYGSDTPVALGLQEGDCFQDPGAGGVIRRVSCDGAHDNEVYSEYSLEYWFPNQQVFPGEPAVAAAVVDTCWTRFERFVGAEPPMTNLGIYPIYPSRASWADGNRTAYCALYAQDLSSLVGSMEGAAE